jgi:hypothetical protein
MLVTNKEPRIHHLGEHVRLLPGANEVDSKAWTEAKKIAVVRHYLDSGAFIEHPNKSAAGIGALPPAEAIRLVNETVDEELLKQMRNAEKRAEVLAAIEAQVTKLQLPAEKAKRK